MPVEIIPGLVCVAVFIAWAVTGGGFAMTSMGPGALFLVALLGLTLLTVRPRLRDIPMAARVALGLLAAFTLWNFLSITWADVPGVAWDGANRTLLYLSVFALFTSLRWRTISIAIVAGVYAAALGVVAFVEIWQAAAASDPQVWFIGGRFAEPTNYANAVAALFIGGFWAALFLGGRRETPWVLRGSLLAVAALLFEVALMTQSRGFVIVFPIAVVAYLAFVTQRVRALAFLVLVALAVAAVASPVLDVFTAAESGGDLAGALGDARGGMMLSFVALAVVGTAIAFIDRRTEVPTGVAVAAGRVTAVLTAGLAVIAVVAAIAAIGNPSEWASARWDDFKGGYSETGFEQSRFTGDLGSNRYDFWRVALDDQFGDSPLIGEGSDNFATTYLVNRRSEEEPLYPHSLEMRILGGTGAVGLLFFGAFAVAALWAAFRARVSAASQFRRGLIGALLAASAYFALHASGDWLWSFPAIAAPAFAWIGMASRATGEEPATASGREASGTRLGPRAAVTGDRRRDRPLRGRLAHPAVAGGSRCPDRHLRLGFRPPGSVSAAGPRSRSELPQRRAADNRRCHRRRNE